MEKFIDGILNIYNWFTEHPFIGGVVSLIVSTLLTVLVVTLLLKLVHHIFKKRQEANGPSITMRFVENIIRGLLIIVAIFWVLLGNPLTSSFGDVIFKGSAVVGAIIGFAAQPVISDLIGGFLLSVSKPFQIGDRIELENDIAGIVKDITFRHVVLLHMDRREIIIPNSVLSKMRIVNSTKSTNQNSYIQKINISYDSNVKEAMEVLDKLVQDSPYTIPGKDSDEGKIYAPPYFLEYGDSALLLGITVYYPLSVSTEVVRTDINLRIDEEFRKHHIEIPYNFVNVVMRNPEELSGAAQAKEE